MRIERLDGEDIENEIIKTLTKPIKESSRLLKLDLSDEIDAIIGFIYSYKYLTKYHTLYGFELQRIKYGNLNKFKSLLYVIIKYIIPYLLLKFKNKILVENWSSYNINHLKRRVYNLIENLELSFGFVKLIEYSIIIGFDGNRTLLERLLNINANVGKGYRNINLEFTQRQLVWCVITEFISTLLNSNLNLSHGGNNNHRYIKNSSNDNNCAICDNDQISLKYKVKGCECNLIYDYTCLIKYLKLNNRHCLNCKKFINEIIRI